MAEQLATQSKPLAFGVELEFTIATLQKDAVDPQPNDPRGTDHAGSAVPQSVEAWENLQGSIVKALALSNIPARSAMAWSRESKKQTVDKNERELFWFVHKDPTIWAPDKDYDWYSVELQSLPLEFDEHSLTQVRWVVTTIKTYFRANVNRSTGLHVHIVNGDLGFDPGTIKQLCAFLWTFENQLKLIHPSHRLENWLHCAGFDHCELWKLIEAHLKLDKGPIIWTTSDIRNFV